jgi:hypothetical protein
MEQGRRVQSNQPTREAEANNEKTRNQPKVFNERRLGVLTLAIPLDSNSFTGGAGPAQFAGEAT